MMSLPQTAHPESTGTHTSTSARLAAAAAIDARGTAEAEWRDAGLLEGLPELELPTGPVVVVAAHPDDEVLGFGGTMATLLAAGVEVHTVCLTDGEASHGAASASARAELAARRRDELRAALAELGPVPDTSAVPDASAVSDASAVPAVSAVPEPVFAALPDTELDAYEYEAATVIGGVLDAAGAAVCVAPWAADLHSDHEAAGRAALRACRSTSLPVWSYPVWMWHWARPDDARVPWHRCGVLPLSEAALGRKKAALARFASQLEPRGPEVGPVLPAEEIAHHTRAFETVIR
ncbi:PIG-L deacetylase family protein [Streptomyces sp. NPDC005863]|uniref:PIG-L deacetylase family protein n=1 Tax=unclassified Streptomyces TaxID=2593676 RepID=UPI0033E0028A